ncbi:MAG: GNAT family N-acetyltransferase [Rubrivivax sp.]|nr:GNAT family N-acetyltransferase [Rubrivivax sp.]
MPQVTLQEITADTVRAVCRLEVGPDQRGNVAPNAVSIAQAHFAPAAWFRGVAADGELVGFVMLSDPSLVPGAPAAEQPFVQLWRFMIDARHQGHGHGRAALALVVAHLRQRHPALRQLFTSTVPGPHTPKAFYEGLGFVANGDWDEGEEVLVLDLDGKP